MSKKNIVPLFSIIHDYQDSLKAYTEAASMLNSAVQTAISLVGKGADPVLAINHLKKYSDELIAASSGIDNESK